MFRTSDAESDATPLNYEWAVRAGPHAVILHICGPAHAGTCLREDDAAMRWARCERCGSRISYAALARLIQRAAPA